MFVGPPNTTGVTQLLDQINARLHGEYRHMKKTLFTPFSTISREGFMEILGNMWPTWTTPNKIKNAARRVGISSEGLSVEWMQQSKFQLARQLISSPPKTPQLASTPAASTPFSPKHIRKGSAVYWKAKHDQLANSLLSPQDISIEEIPGFLQVKKVQSRAEKKSVRITQICGSLTGQQVIEKVKEIHNKKTAAEDKKK